MRLSRTTSAARSQHQAVVPDDTRTFTFKQEWMALRVLVLWPPIWVVLVLALMGLVLVYQEPHTYSVEVGTPQDQAYVRNFHARQTEGDHAYRWSDVYGYVSFPGLGGSRPFTVTMALDPARVAPVTVIINGVTYLSKNLDPGWHSLTFVVDSSHPDALSSRDTVIEVRAPDYRSPELPSESKGVKLSDVTIEQAAMGGLIVPSYSTLLLLEATLLLLYLLVGRSFVWLADRPRTRLWGLSAVIISSILIMLALRQSHVAVSVAAAHFLVTLASSLVLLVLAERLVPKLGSWARTTVNPTSTQRRLTGLCVAAAFAVRFGGMGLPQSVIIDMPWHMKWLRTLLSGDWQSLYFPGGLSSVPREWGLDLLIPKSPLFYFTAAPLGFLPFELETLVKWLICFIDATLVLAVFWLVLRLGTKPWAAIMGATLYAFMPLAFRAFAYGILPTIFAQWLAALALIAVLSMGARKWGVVRWVALSLLISLALLSFPTVALFLTLVMFAYAIVWWFTTKNDSVARDVRPPLLLLSLAAAWLVAILAYYGLYIAPVLQSVSALLAPRPEGGSTVKWPGGFAELLGWTAAYLVSILPALLALLGTSLLVWAKRPQDSSARRAFWLIVIWVLIAPLFLIVNYRVDMIGKHLFFTMLPLAALGGAAIYSFLRRGKWGVALSYLALSVIMWQGIVFWISRLVEAST